jgi:hypothetical protein
MDHLRAARTATSALRVIELASPGIGLIVTVTLTGTVDWAHPPWLGPRRLDRA